MNDLKAIRYRWEDIPKEALKPNLARRLISTDRMMLAQVYLQKGCVVPTHERAEGSVSYERVCVEGPVMRAERVAW